MTQNTAPKPSNLSSTEDKLICERKKELREAILAIKKYKKRSFKMKIIDDQDLKYIKAIVDFFAADTALESRAYGSIEFREAIVKLAASINSYRKAKAINNVSFLITRKLYLVNRACDVHSLIE